MNGKQYDAHTWLSRTWDTEAYIQNKVDQRDKLNSWGVGHLSLVLILILD